MIDLLNIYKKKNKLKAEFIGKEISWLDTDDIKISIMHHIVSSIESKKRYKIGCLEEIAYKNRWINKNHLKNAINFYGKCNYSKYLKSLI